MSGTGQPRFLVTESSPLCVWLLQTSRYQNLATYTQYSKALNNLCTGMCLCIRAVLCLFCLKIGSAILSKIQNILLGYEQRIKREKNRYTAVWREIRKLESEKEESRIIAKETQDLKSILAHQEMEWKSDIQSLKYVTLCSDYVLSCQCSCSRRCWWYKVIGWEVSSCLGFLNPMAGSTTKDSMPGDKMPGS